jgi:myo-inositol 2-dehydrogenase/D-chiro-inositol 1-dehydrogenase
MRVALVGAGRIGQLHGRLLAAQADVEQVIVADADPVRARASAEAIGGRLAATVDEALGSSDAVVIAASTNAHASLVKMALERRLPTFVEKPLAFDLADAEALVDKIEKAGVRVQVGFQRRFDPAYVEARRMVKTGELGTVYLVRLASHDHEPPPDDYIPTSGGLFRDSSIHDFDALRWVTGQEVEQVYAAGSVRGFPVFARHDDVDTGAVILELADGTLAVLGQTRHDPRGYDIRMEIIGSKDAITLGLTPRTPLRSVDADGLAMPGPAWTSFLTRFEVAYQTELLAFLRVARGEIESPCTARDALEAMRISVAATCSRSERKPVRLRDIGSRPRSPDREGAPRKEVDGPG